MSGHKSSSKKGSSNASTGHGSPTVKSPQASRSSKNSDKRSNESRMVESSSESGSSESDSEFTVNVTRTSRNAAILETAAQIEQRRTEGVFDDPNDLSLDSSSSEVEEDDEAIMAGPIADNFMELLSKIKSKHPDIYDKEKAFFPTEIEVEEQDKPEARITIKDMQREDILARVAKGDDAGSDSSDEEEDEKSFKSKQKGGLSYAQEQDEARKALLSAAWEDEISGSDDEDKASMVKKKVEAKKEAAKEADRKDYADEAGLVKKSDSHTQTHAFENEYQAFVKRQEMIEATAAKKAEKKATSLLQYWHRRDLDEGEQFLRDFVLNKRWMGGEEEETTKKSKKSIVPADDEDAEDTKELEKQDDFETAYNFRYEDPNGAQLVTHARSQESVRVEKNKRAEKRARKRERQRLSKQAAEEEKITEKKRHKEEILARISELSAASGLSDGVKKLVKDEEDWDPETHDEAMGTAFNEEYYAQAEEDMPATGADVEDVEKWLERMKEKSGEGGKAAPNTDAIQNALEDYYNLDFEDDVAGEKTRFRYTKVAPQRYGLSNEDLLNMSDDELDQLIPIKTLATYREDGGYIKKDKIKYKRILLAKTRSEARRQAAGGSKHKKSDNQHDEEEVPRPKHDKKRKRESLDGSEVKETQSHSKKKTPVK